MPLCSTTDNAPHAGKHPLEPANLEKHVAEAKPKAEIQQQKAASPSAASKAPSTGSLASLEFSQIPARYRRPVISDIEMEVIQVSRQIAGRQKRQSENTHASHLSL
jgi:hypothetical protein